ncbi:MAG: M15 family metallopeptidase [Proteobacteria bacterium]|nr:M15 family metallopeptidase [Pseudomonadota bacterium]
MVSAKDQKGSDSQAKSLPKGLKRLVKAYPDSLSRASTKDRLVWRDGTTMAYDDGTKKSFKQMLEYPDLEDQMSLEYPKNWSPSPPVNFDPGRIRYEPFFKKMYGNSSREVRAKLKPVIWLPGVSGKKILMTSTNRVDEKMRSVSKEILRLPHKVVRKVSQVSGTFVWRTIEGCKRLSTHSFGIAIDIGGQYADYWRWTKPGPNGIYRYKNQIPLEVVKIFERHGFIWGGKWYHFDTMHFEYRPELAN